MADGLGELLEKAYGPGDDPFAMGPAPPPGYRGYDYKPEMTPYQAFVRPMASSEMAKREPNWFGRNVLEPASKVPGLMEWAAFIGPKGAANLAKARIRHPDDWGGTNRLAHAKEHPQWGMPDAAARREIWKHFGWTDEATWGTHGMGRGAQPATIIATPEFGVNLGSMRPMQSGKHKTYQGEGKVPEMLRGLDEVLVAEPSLAEVMAKLHLDPSLKIEPGVTVSKALWKDNVKRIGEDPIGHRPTHIEASGFDLPSLEGTALHEVHHGVAIPQKLTPPTFQSQQMNPIRGTLAEQQIEQKLKQIPSYDPNLSPPTPRAGERAADRARRQTLEQMAAEARSNAGYFALADELLARSGKVLGKRKLSELTDLPPALVDTYQPGALAKGLEAQMPFPLEAYRPPWLKKPE